MCLCVSYLLRGPLADLRQTCWLYVGGPPICPSGVLFRKGQRVTFAFHYIIYAPASRQTGPKGAFCFAGSAAESNSAFFAALHVNGVCRWTSQLLLRGSFSKRSTGQKGQQVTFTILYMIADDARLTPPRCKKHTASFARSTGKFPSIFQIGLVGGCLWCSCYYIVSWPSAQRTRVQVLVPVQI